MSATQRPTRRRSNRLDNDEEEGRPAKKAKLDEATNGTVKAGTGKKNAAVPRKGKAAYDEDADGFTFSRAKTKKSSKEEPKVDAPAQEDDASRPQPTKKPRRSAEGAPAENDAPRRRSARLSGDKAQHQAEERSMGPPKKPQEEPRGRQIERTPGEGPLHVDKKRRTTKIALPFADTPVIMRNKEMRKTSGGNHRRSSSSMRGRRASSLIDGGLSNALPHDEVATANFYKHIAQDIPEPQRMKMLLTWCALRAMPAKTTGSGSAPDVSVKQAARVVQEELLKDFTNKSEMSYWFDRDDTAPTSLLKKPNPRNVQNAAKLQELEREVQRLKSEKESWDKVLSSVSSIEGIQQKQIKSFASSGTDVRSIDASLLDDSAQQSILKDLISQSQVESAVISRMRGATDSLEFKIDSLANGVHRIDKFKETTDVVVDQIQKHATKSLEDREQKALEENGTAGVGIRDIMRQLSRTERRLP